MPHLNEPISIPLKLAISANTARGAAVRATALFREEVIVTDIWLQVPSGHSGLVPVWFELDYSQVFPTQGETEYRLDDFADFIVIKNARFRIRAGQRLDLVGYNEDTVNAHTTRAYLQGYIVQPGHAMKSNIPGPDFAEGLAFGAVI